MRYKDYLKLSGMINVNTGGHYKREAGVSMRGDVITNKRRELGGGGERVDLYMLHCWLWGWRKESQPKSLDGF